MVQSKLIKREKGIKMSFMLNKSNSILFGNREIITSNNSKTDF